MQEPDVDALIRLLETQRAALGGAAVDFALAALRDRQTAAQPARPRLRQLSILFCDIAGSTALLQRLQVEDALALVGTALQGFAVRVGINTGPMVLGGGIEADKTAMGHAVNIAARMEQSAPVGTLRISHGTWVHVRGLFSTEAQAPLVVKGSDALAALQRSDPALAAQVYRNIALYLSERLRHAASSWRLDAR